VNLRRAVLSCWRLSWWGSAHSGNLVGVFQLAMRLKTIGLARRDFGWLCTITTLDGRLASGVSLCDPATRREPTGKPALASLRSKHCGHFPDHERQLRPGRRRCAGFWIRPLFRGRFGANAHQTRWGYLLMGIARLPAALPTAPLGPLLRQHKVGDSSRALPLNLLTLIAFL